MSRYRAWGGPLIAVTLLTGCEQGCGQLGSVPGGVSERVQVGGGLEIHISEAGLGQVGAWVPQLLTELLPQACGAPTALTCPTEFRDPMSGAPQPSRCEQGRCVEGQPARVAPVLGFPISAVQNGNIEVCPAGTTPGCAAWLRLEGAQLGTRSAATVEMELSAQIRTSVLPVRAQILGNTVVCEVTLDTGASGAIVETVDVDFEVAPYMDPTTMTSSRLRVLVQDVDANFANDDIAVGAPSGASLGDRLACAGLNAVRGLLATALTAQLSSVLQEEIDSALGQSCLQGCGSATCVDDVCIDSAGVVVPQSLGVEGRVDLGTLLSSVLEPKPFELDVFVETGPGALAQATGLELSAVMGVDTRSRDATCSPARTHPVLAAGHTPAAAWAMDERADLDFDGRGETSYMVAVGLSREVLDPLVWAVEQAGTLCAELDGEDVALLNTGALGLVLPSLARLTGGSESEPQLYPIEIQLRPQRVDLVMGTGEPQPGDNSTFVSPLLSLQLPDAELVVHAPIEERWVRLFSTRLDIDLPLGLNTTPTGGLAVVLDPNGGIVANVRATAEEILAETPAEVEAALPALLQIALPQILAGLPTIELPAFAGFRLDVVGVRGVGQPVERVVAYADLRAVP